MARRNGSIIGPANIPTGGIGGVASGVWRIQDAMNYQKAGLWPVVAANPTNSLRFNSGSSDYLNRTPATNGNRQLWTFSAWVKLSNLTLFRAFLQVDTDAADVIYFTNTDTIRLVFAGNSVDVSTTAVFRDVSAWYHLVLNYNGTTLKLWVNGVEYISTAMSGNTKLNDSSYVHYLIGNFKWDGYMSEVNFIDAQALDASYFGEFNSATGIWTPVAYSGSFGTNGFNLKFENAADLGEDSSTNGNDFTVNNLTSIDQTTDLATNNFATLNTLNVPTSNAPTFSEGNLKTVTNGVDGNFGGTSTIGISQGKWYAEFKFISTTAGMLVGVTGDPSNDARLNNYTGENILGYSVYSANGNKYNNASNSAFGVSWTTNDIIGVALDLDNHKIYFHKNGVYMNSGDPTSGATGTGSAFNLTTGYDYFFSVSDGSSGDSSTIDANFGNPPFTISSGNADANGFGNFEYSVPSGYYALNTYNLNQLG